MFAIKRYVRGTTPTPAQGYFRATMLMLVTFDVFTLSPYFSIVPSSSDVREAFDAICNTEKKAREAAHSSRTCTECWRRTA